MGVAQSPLGVIFFKTLQILLAAHRLKKPSFAASAGGDWWELSDGKAQYLCHVTSRGFRLHMRSGCARRRCHVDKGSARHDDVPETTMVSMAPHGPRVAMPGMTMSRPDRMHMDLNDVSYDAFLANDRTLADPEIVHVERDGRIRLRVITPCCRLCCLGPLLSFAP
jgi:hypothetical protein